MAVYNIHEAKTQLSKLVALAESGEEVVIARNGAPVVKISALAAEAQPMRVFGQFDGLMTDDEIDAVFSPAAEAEIRAMFDEAIEKPLFSGDGSKPAAE